MILAGAETNEPQPHLCDPTQGTVSQHWHPQIHPGAEPLLASHGLNQVLFWEGQQGQPAQAVLTIPSRKAGVEAGQPAEKVTAPWCHT